MWRLVSLAATYARRFNQGRVIWLVHALDCETPNPRLQRFLERRGFIPRDWPGVGVVYWRADTIRPAT
jgi:hypothetical protein